MPTESLPERPKCPFCGQSTSQRVIFQADTTSPNVVQFEYYVCSGNGCWNNRVARIIAKAKGCSR